MEEKRTLRPALGPVLPHRNVVVVGKDQEAGDLGPRRSLQEVHLSRQEAGLLPVIARVPVPEAHLVDRARI